MKTVKQYLQGSAQHETDCMQHGRGEFVLYTTVQPSGSNKRSTIHPQSRLTSFADILVFEKILTSNTSCFTRHSVTSLGQAQERGLFISNTDFLKSWHNMSNELWEGKW